MERLIPVPVPRQSYCRRCPSVVALRVLGNISNSSCQSLHFPTIEMRVKQGRVSTSSSKELIPFANNFSLVPIDWRVDRAPLKLRVLIAITAVEICYVHVNDWNKNSMLQTRKGINSTLHLMHRPQSNRLWIETAGCCRHLQVIV